jgi:hypothetical protein
MACDKPSNPAAGDTTAGKGSSWRVGLHAASPKGGLRIKLQLTMCPEDGHDEAGTDIATLRKVSQRIKHLGVTHAVSVL